jgi:hypothetical protein
MYVCRCVCVYLCELVFSEDTLEKWLMDFKEYAGYGLCPLPRSC